MYPILLLSAIHLKIYQSKLYIFFKKICLNLTEALFLINKVCNAFDAITANAL